MPAAYLRIGEQIQGRPHPRRTALLSFPVSNSSSELAQALVKSATSSCCADVGAHCTGWQLFLPRSRQQMHEITHGSVLASHNTANNGKPPDALYKQNDTNLFQ